MNELAVLPLWQLAIAKAFFDEDYYLQCYEDVRLAGLDAFEHFMKYGAREGRKPCKGIDLKVYLVSHPELRDSQVNPFIHYLLIGLLEQFVPRPAPASVRAIQAAAPDTGRTPSTVDRHSYLEFERVLQLLSLALKGQPKAVLALSHTHYATITGGTENVVAAEAEALTAAGWVYLHVHPLTPTATFEGGNSKLGRTLVLTINGKKSGYVDAFCLAMAISEARRSAAASIHLVIHHLIGFELESVVALARACGTHAVTVWIHDFFTLCVDPFLMRNDVQFCAAPQGDSTSCLVCSKGLARRVHVDRMRALFKALQPRVIAPSSTHLRFWENRNNYDVADVAVVPIANIFLGNTIPEEARPDGPLRVAYLGAAVWLKGWLTFQKVVNLLQYDDRYQFFRFGYGNSEEERVTEVGVRVTSDDPLAMVRAVASHEIDVVINWSACHESFSYVTGEALAAGASVVARAGAGNIPHLIASVAPERGRIFRTEVELMAYFISGEAMTMKGRRLGIGGIERTSATASRLLS